MIDMCPDCGRPVEPGEDIYIMTYGYCWHCVDGEGGADECDDICPDCGEQMDDGVCPYACECEDEED